MRCWKYSPLSSTIPRTTVISSHSCTGILQSKLPLDIFHSQQKNTGMHSSNQISLLPIQQGYRWTLKGSIFGTESLDVVCGQSIPLILTDATFIYVTQRFTDQTLTRTEWKYPKGSLLFPKKNFSAYMQRCMECMWNKTEHFHYLLQSG